MSGATAFDITVTGIRLAVALGQLMSLDPEEAKARNERIKWLACQRRAGQLAADEARGAELAEREERARRLAVARVDAAGSAAALAAAGMPADVPAEPLPGAEPAEWDAWCAAVEAVREDVYRRVTAARLADAVRGLADPTGDLVTAAEALARGPAGMAGSADAAVPAAALTSPPAGVARLLAALDPLAAGVDLSVVYGAAAEVLRRPDETAARLTALRLHVQEANDRARARRADAIVAAELLDLLDPYQPEPALRARLVGVASGAAPLDDDLLDAVEALRSSVEERAAARAVGDAMAEVLEDLGYQVGPDFSLGTATAGRLEVADPRRPGHLVRMAVDPAAKAVRAQIYRHGSADPATDDEAEDAWCDSLDEAVRRLAGSGVDLTATYVSERGALPVPSTGGTAEPARRAGPKERRVE